MENEELYTWTSCYDKDGNPLEKPVTKFIKDLDTDHIYKILNSKFLHLSEEQIEIFKNELKIRNENMVNE